MTVLANGCSTNDSRSVGPLFSLSVWLACLPACLRPALCVLLWLLLLPLSAAVDAMRRFAAGSSFVRFFLRRGRRERGSGVARRL